MALLNPFMRYSAILASVCFIALRGHLGLVHIVVNKWIKELQKSIKQAAAMILDYRDQCCHYC